MNLGKETETLEFKKTTGEMKEAMVSISSILKIILAFKISYRSWERKHVSYICNTG